MKSVKDFVYLDSERIRSYLAQIEGRLVDIKTKSSEHSVGTQAGANTSGLVKLFAEAEASANYMYQKTNSETSSLHHAAFDLLYKKLKSSNTIATNTTSEDKPFIEVTSSLRIVDYSLLAEQLTSLTTLMPLIQKISDNAKAAISTSDAGAMKNVAKAIKLLYGDLRVLQLVKDDGEIIAQITLSDELNLPKTSLLTTSSNEVLPGKWTIFGLKIPPSENIPDQFGDNELAIALSQVSSSLDEIKTILFNNQNLSSVTPIAIYRQLL